MKDGNMHEMEKWHARLGFILNMHENEVWSENKYAANWKWLYDALGISDWQ